MLSVRKTKYGIHKKVQYGNFRSFVNKKINMDSFNPYAFSYYPQDTRRVLQSVDKVLKGKERLSFKIWVHLEEMLQKLEMPFEIFLFVNSRRAIITHRTEKKRT